MTPVCRQWSAHGPRASDCARRQKGNHMIWLALPLLLLLAAPAHAERPLLVCDTPTREDAVFVYYACPFELEPGREIIVQFRMPIRGTPSPSLRGDYLNYYSSEGTMKRCITWQQTWISPEGLRGRVYSTCDVEKYLVIELAVPR